MKMKGSRTASVDVLAIAAHPDDAELTCGGTLAQSVRRGYRVGILDLTQGEMGTRGSPETRAREAARAAKLLGLHHRENLGLADARLEPTQANKRAVAARLRALRPGVVILPYWEGRHPDHTHACQIAYQACYLAGLKKLDLAGPPHRPFKILYSPLYDESGRTRPSFVVDITRDYSRRARAIACYRSQFSGRPRQERGVHLPLADLQERLAALCRYYGQLIGVKYGEPFLTREVMQVDDIVGLAVRSI
ncbi:MAG: bacillithiol biosynthesis deacetylase BshB1 [Terriglobia bacterium]